MLNNLILTTIQTIFMIYKSSHALYLKHIIYNAEVGYISIKLEATKSKIILNTKIRNKYQ